MGSCGRHFGLKPHRSHHYLLKSPRSSSQGPSRGVPSVGAGALRGACAVVPHRTGACSSVTPAAVAFTHGGCAESHARCSAVPGNGYRINPGSSTASGDPDAGLTPAEGTGSLGCHSLPRGLHQARQESWHQNHLLDVCPGHWPRAAVGCGLSAPSASEFMA